VKTYALSLKQPWAALLVHRRKTIEVRRWPTRFTGRLLIHASSVPDERPEAWAHVSPEVAGTARLGGGIIGVGTLIGCRSYRSVEAFTADQADHLNEATWFEAAGLFGFAFAELEVLPFRRYPGWVRIFEVKDELPRRCARQGADDTVR